MASERGIGRIERRLIVVAALLALALTAAGEWLYRRERDRIGAEVRRQVEAISSLHQRLIASWRRERLADARAIASPALAERFAGWLIQPNAHDRELLERRLELAARSYGYSRVSLLDAAGSIQVAWGEASSGPPPGSLGDLLRAEEPRLLDLPPEGETGTWALFGAAPLVELAGRRVGSLLVEMDAGRALEPLLAPVPTPAGAVESRLLAREWREPSAGAAAAAPAWGVDQAAGARGGPRVRYRTPVPGSPWSLVTEVALDDPSGSALSRRLRLATALLIAFLAAAVAYVLAERLRRRRSEGALRETEGRFQAIFDQALDAILITDRDGRFLDANRAAIELLGYELPELRRRRVGQLIDAEDLRRDPISWTDLDAGHSVRRERRLIQRDGSRVPAELVTTPLEDGRRLTVARDIRARRAAETRLELLSRALERSPAPTLITDARGTIQYVNPRFTQVTGWNAADSIGQTPRLLASGRTPAELYREMWSTIAAGREWTGTLLNRRRNGELFWWDLAISPITADDGSVQAFVAIGEDVSRRREESERMRQSRRLARLADWSYDVAAERLWLSDEAARLLDLEPGAARPSVERLLGRVHPEDREALREAFTRAAGHGTGYEIAFRVGGQEEPRRFLNSVVEVERDFGGAPLRLIGVLQDLTELERSREALESARAELAQAQKMDAIGRLAGGVAHDFNNLLGVVLGHAELLEQELPADAGQRESTREIARAAMRGAELARQLLALGRRSISRPRRVDVATELAEAGRLLRRLIPANIGLECEAAPGLWGIEVDPIHLTQVLVNLALNARDAVGDGGSIRIAAANDAVDARRARVLGAFEPGDYVRFDVVDDGAGIAPDLLPRIFEPFFSTKQEGPRAGFGLATVYGLVRQAGGWTRVESRAGEGTCISVWLPRCDRADRTPSGESEVRGERPPESPRAVLLVEDQPELRGSLERMLRALGYQVVSAGSAEEAVRRFREHGEVALLLSDVVLPARNGKQLASELRTLRPELPVVLMSGYSAVSEEDFKELVDAGYAFLQKPFGLQELKRALSARLG